MYANNRYGEAPRSTFRTAGGAKYYYGHPYLHGQLTTSVRGEKEYEVDISKCFRLNDTFFNAQPLQDSAVAEVAVDGSLIIITNHLMAGQATLQVLPGTGLIKDGDLTKIAPFIMSSKDDLGGYLRRVRLVGGKAITRVYYDVTFKTFPHDLDAGNSVPIYPINILYGGWIEGVLATSDEVVRALWAVGAAEGFEGVYSAADSEADDAPGSVSFDSVNADGETADTDEGNEEIDVADSSSVFTSSDE